MIERYSLKWLYLSFYVVCINIISGVLPGEHLLMRGEISGLTGGVLSFFSDTDGQGVVVER